MKRVAAITILLSITFSPPCQATGQPLTASAQETRGLIILNSNVDGITFELDTSLYDITTEASAFGTIHHISLPELSTTLVETGPYQMPAVSTLIGVPSDAELELRVISADSTTLTGPYQMPAVRHAAPIIDDFQPGTWISEQIPIAKSGSTRYPTSLARITTDGWLRDQRIARLEIYPFQYDSSQHTLTWHRQLIVKVHFIQNTPGTRPSANEGANPFEAILSQSLPNYDIARSWRNAKAQPNAEPQFSSLGARYKISVDQDGIYRLTYAELQAAGLDIDAVNPASFHLTTQGQDVSIYVHGERDGSFDPGDYITFYGQKFRGNVLAARYAIEMDGWLTVCSACQLKGIFEKYTDENAYWLTTGGAGGARMGTIDGTPNDTLPVSTYYTATVHAEQSHEWYTHHFSSEDTWFWERVKDTLTRTYTTTLSAVAPITMTGNISATVHGSMAARTTGSHQTRFWINDQTQVLDETPWSGKTGYDFEFQTPQTALIDGENQLHFASGNYDDLYFNWFGIEYARQFQAEGNQIIFSYNEAGTAQQYEIGNFTDSGVEIFDITSPLTPIRVLTPTLTTGTAAFTGSHISRAQYIAVGSDTAIKSPNSITYYVPPDFTSMPEADYVFITHPNFYTATQALANYRGTLGLSTQIVEIDDLYNEFNDGIYHPIAIRNFLSYIFASWTTPPSYVVLIGDGHWDFKNFKGNNEPIYMPPNLAFVDPWQGEVDSVNLLATVVGDDPLPDVLIGRIPVNSDAELQTVVDKITSYEQSGLGDWQRNFLFLADNSEDAGDFVATSDEIIANFIDGSPYIANRIYQDDYGCSSSGSPECEAVTAALTQTLNMTGTLLMTYNGHGALSQWSNERIFTNADIAVLTNINQLPVVLSMDCLDGYWLYPNNPGMMEELLRANYGGAVATYSPTGLGLATGHDVLQGGFFEALINSGIRELGLAVLQSKLALYQDGNNQDLLQTFTIFGDPALRIQLSSYLYIPLVMK